MNAPATIWVNNNPLTEVDLEAKERALWEIARVLGVEIFFPKKVTFPPHHDDVTTWAVDSRGIIYT